MQINPVSSIFIANGSGQVVAPSDNTQIKRVDFLRGTDAREQRVLEKSHVNRQANNSLNTNSFNNSLVVRSANDQFQIDKALNKRLNKDFLTASSQEYKSTARLVNPENKVAALSRNAVIAYETISHLDDRSQLTEILGFDAFA